MAIRLRAGAIPVFSPLGRRAFSCRPLVVVAGLLAACGGEGVPATPRSGEFVTDDAGRVVLLAPAPQRIVSLLPSATELLIALGESSRLVARTEYDQGPGLAHLPSLGATLSPSLERIVALEPDLVIAASDVMSGGFASRLASTGVRVYEVDAQRVEDVLSTIRRVSLLVGSAPRGEVLRARVTRELGSLRASTAAAPRTRVLYLLWHSPPYVSGRDTYVDDLIESAGGLNIFSDVRGWGTVSLEEVIVRKPDVIVVPSAEGHSLQPEWLSEATGWRGVPAVREGRLLVVESDLFNRPGPRVLEAARILADALHPERPR